MGHLIIIIIQISFIILFALCKYFNLPEISICIYTSWIIPICYYNLIGFNSLFKKKYFESIFYLIFTTLIFCIPNKIWFVYHNVFFQLIIIILFILLFIKIKIKSFHIFFVIFSFVILIFNIALVFMNDTVVYEKLASSHYYGVSTYSNTKFGWDKFKKVENSNQNYSAGVNSYIFTIVNKVYNYTPAIVVAKMNFEKSFYVKKSQKLLEHEYCHFKITEIITRKLNSKLKKCHFLNEDETYKIIFQHEDSLELMQNSYDFETNHSLNSENQLKWEKRIEEFLSDKNI